MYRGFNLTLDEESDDFYHKGRKLYMSNKQAVGRTLDSFISPNGSINGSEMQSNWFPQIDADIFISHSHQDEKIAVSLAGWLCETFGITSFIDSCIWGYSNELLKQVDNKYCLNSSEETYSYEKRNKSTSHVHMMLSTALNMMIDKTECLFFLNTPNSITTREVISQTESPWIYSEISMSELVRKKKLSEYRPAMTKSLSKGALVNEGLNFKYDVNHRHLTDIDDNILSKWKDEWNRIPKLTDYYALDILYKLNQDIL